MAKHGRACMYSVRVVSPVTQEWMDGLVSDVCLSRPTYGDTEVRVYKYVLFLSLGYGIHTRGWGYGVLLTGCKLSILESD